MYGFPLRIFSKNIRLYPLFSLYHFSEIEKATSFLLGTTNQIVLGNNKLKFDAVINLDTHKITINDNNVNSACIKISKLEKNIFNKIYDKIKDNFKEEKENWMINLNYYDPDFEGSDDYIRNEIKNYFYNFFVDVSLSMEISGKNYDSESPTFTVNKNKNTIQLENLDNNFFESIEDDFDNLFSKVKGKISKEKSSDKGKIILKLY